mmetsp:Transcript_4674/g.8116  ORF Transcript_4674/g.8116 Transcript_4674/m.8116 type:complete len:243 (-) Transcript_4674:924-1652(-)
MTQCRRQASFSRSCRTYQSDKMYHLQFTEDPMHLHPSSNELMRRLRKATPRRAEILSSLWWAYIGEENRNVMVGAIFREQQKLVHFLLRIFNHCRGFHSLPATLKCFPQCTVTCQGSVEITTKNCCGLVHKRFVLTTAHDMTDAGIQECFPHLARVACKDEDKLYLNPASSNEVLQIVCHDSMGFALQSILEVQSLATAMTGEVQGSTRTILAPARQEFAQPIRRPCLEYCINLCPDFSSMA